MFQSQKVRTAWDDEKEEWYFSLVDTCAVLNDIDYDTAIKYLKVPIKYNENSRLHI